MKKFGAEKASARAPCSSASRSSPSPFPRCRRRPCPSRSSWSRRASSRCRRKCRDHPPDRARPALRHLGHHGDSLRRRGPAIAGAVRRLGWAATFRSCSRAAPCCSSAWPATSSGAAAAPPRTTGRPLTSAIIGTWRGSRAGSPGWERQLWWWPAPWPGASSASGSWPGGTGSPTTSASTRRSSARSRRTTRTPSRATSSSRPPSARCCAPSIPTRTSWRRRSTAASRSARRARTTASASPCSRSTGTSPWSRRSKARRPHRLGIRAGDVISKIEAEDARGMAIDDAVKRLRGPKGTPVHITIVRQGYDTPARVHRPPRRDPAALRALLLHGLEEDGVRPAHRLQRDDGLPARRGPPTARTSWRRRCSALTQQGATSMILDIRDNPGGLLDQAFAVSNLFLKKGQMVVFTRGRTKRDETNYITETESPFVDHAPDRAHLEAQRERLGDRGRRHPGPRPRPASWGRRPSARAWSRRSCRCATCAATPWP